MHRCAVAVPESSGCNRTLLACYELAGMHWHALAPTGGSSPG
jgi:hypothetical protein